MFFTSLEKEIEGKKRDAETGIRHKCGNGLDNIGTWTKLMAVEIFLLQYSWPQDKVTLPYGDIFLLLLRMILTSLLGT